MINKYLVVVGLFIIQQYIGNHNNNLLMHEFYSSMS
jgi:hypothetical protein